MLTCLQLAEGWILPEEVGMFQRRDKPLLLTNQIIQRPGAHAPRTHLLLSPSHLSGKRSADAGGCNTQIWGWSVSSSSSVINVFPPAAEHFYSYNVVLYHTGCTSFSSVTCYVAARIKKAVQIQCRLHVKQQVWHWISIYSFLTSHVTIYLLHETVHSNHRQHVLFPPRSNQLYWSGFGVHP